MLTIFENIYNTTVLVEENGDLFEVLDDLFNNFRFNTKTDGFLICPSKFQGTRGLENHVYSDCMGLDIDGGISIPQTITALEKLGIGAYIYTTPSSRNLDRFRVFLKFSAPVTDVGDYKKIWAVMNDALNGSVDAATQHAACVFYTPARYFEADNFTTMVDGNPIDVGLLTLAGSALLVPSKAKLAITPVSEKQDTVQKTQRAIALKAYDPTFLNLQDCKFVKQQYLDEYCGLASGTHYRGLYVFMTRVAGLAKAKKYQISVQQLAELARQLDLAYRGWNKKRDIKNEAENAVLFVYGGNA